MAKQFSRGFYSSAAWLSAREAYAKSKRYCCERCGAPGAVEVHHIVPLTPENIYDPEITTSFENLMLCCHRCHREIHRQLDGKDDIALRYTFDCDGKVFIKK